MLGKLLIYIALSLSICSSVMYFLSIKKRTLLPLARRMFYGLSVTVLTISTILFVNIFNHNFQISYIWENSSKQLSSLYLIASFYAGQQGSFLLWLTYYAILGFFLIKYCSKKNTENIIMAFYAMIMMFLLVLLVVKSPFDYIWDTFSYKNIPLGFNPVDGKGLNPILETFWMVIHPPVLFIGYTLVTIPFLFALAALINKDYRTWIDNAYPWALFSSAILGLGIMLGGFWAYETLGWGGFWGWDPVENSSLMPWLTSMALVHTIIVQRKTNALTRLNLLLALITYILVIYATFLTRSGVLGATSVHSFTDPGNSVYFILLFVLSAIMIISFLPFIKRKKELSLLKVSMNFTSREFMLTLGSIFIILTSLIVFFGTSLPIFSELFGLKKSSVQGNFYNNTIAPILVLILVSNALCLYLSWKKYQYSALFKRIALSASITLVATILFAFAGIRQFGVSLLMFSIIFSLIVNMEFSVRNLIKNPLTLGGYISHIGISVLMIGIIMLSLNSTTETFRLRRGETKTIAGYQYSFIGKSIEDSTRTDRQKFQYRIGIKNDNFTDVILPSVCWSDFNRRQAPVFSPGIKSLFLNDIYVVLKSSEYLNELNTIELKKNSTGKCPLDSEINISLVKVDIQKKNSVEGQPPLLGAEVKYKRKNSEMSDTLFTLMKTETTINDLIWRQLPNSGIEITFSNFISSLDDTNQTRAVFSFKKVKEKIKEPIEIITAEVSFKPFISFVWAGVMIIVIGFVISYIKNIKESGNNNVLDSNH